MSYKFVDVNKLTRDEARVKLRDALDYIEELEEKVNKYRTDSIETSCRINSLEKEVSRLGDAKEMYLKYFKEKTELTKENELLNKTINLLNNEIGILNKGYNSIQQVVDLQRELIVSRDRIIEGFMADKEKTNDMQRKTED